MLEGAFWRLPGGPVLELLQFLEPEGSATDPAMVNPGASHLGLACDDLRTEFARLKAAGVDLRSEEPVEIPWGPYKGGVACFVRDPDGNFMEIFQLPPGGPAFEG